MIVKLSDNIISPLGASSETNLEALLRDETRLRKCAKWGLPEPVCTSMFSGVSIDGFEALCIRSASRAIESSGIDPTSPETIFILSTTKGNVALIADYREDSRAYLGYSAKRIAEHFGAVNEPLTVSNACISGVCAQIAAMRALKYGRYRTAVVIGCDLLSKFIVSGFMSFKALSQENCKPYDKQRVGLNLGEAAATMVLQRVEESEDRWEYVDSAICNDANHISGPSRTGEGSYRVLERILHTIDKDELAVVNTHGTATLYNDEMESIALHRAGLDNTPVNALKGYYGHTLGAAGLLETIITMHALDRGVLLPTRGYEECGVTYPLNISNELRQTDKRAFIKLLSGFGGCNAGIAYRKGGAR